MNHRPQWYERYVEVPLGHKQVPVISTVRFDDWGEAPPDADAQHERLLTDLAHAAVQLIQARLSRGEPARTVVAEVLNTVFGADVDDGHVGRAYDDRVERVLRDAGELDRIVAAVQEIVGIGHTG
jgi:hypothetical protein